MSDNSTTNTTDDSAATFTNELNALVAVATEIARDHGWCGEWRTKVCQLSNAFNDDGSTVTVDVSAVIGIQIDGFDVDTDLSDAGKAKYAALAEGKVATERANIRGRILNLAGDGYLTSDEVNLGIAAIGAEPLNVPGTNRLIYFPSVVTTSDGAKTDRQHTKALTAALDAFKAAVDAIDGLSGTTIYGEGNVTMERYTPMVDYRTGRVALLRRR